MAASYQDTAPTAPVPEKASLFEDFIDIFHSPSKVFARRANSGFVLIMVVVSVIMGLLAFGMAGPFETLMEAEFRKNAATMMEQNPSLTEEQVANMQRIGLMGAKATLYVITPLLILVFGLVVWLVGKVFGAALTYGQAAMIVAYAQIPRILGSIVFIVQGLMLDPAGQGMASFTLSPARFMDPATTSAGLLQLLMRLDIFVLWVTILIGIGISVVGKIPREKGYIAAAVLWVIGSLGALMTLARG